MHKEAVLTWGWLPNPVRGHKLHRWWTKGGYRGDLRRCSRAHLPGPSGPCKQTHLGEEQGLRENYTKDNIVLCTVSYEGQLAALVKVNGLTYGH